MGGVYKVGIERNVMCEGNGWAGCAGVRNGRVDYVGWEWQCDECGQGGGGVVGCMCVGIGSIQSYIVIHLVGPSIGLPYILMYLWFMLAVDTACNAHFSIFIVCAYGILLICYIYSLAPFT